jgi:hypothetical protein
MDKFRPQLRRVYHFFNIIKRHIINDVIFNASIPSFGFGLKVFYASCFSLSLKATFFY